MKALFALAAIVSICAILIAACNAPHEEYKPGMGELMTSIQLHHAKLWFAGKNAAWPLAAYNESLIESAFKKLQRYHPGTAEARDAVMIDGPLDSVSAAIARKDGRAFGQSFALLTTTCNNCHAVTKHAYNVILIPQGLPVDNQDFTAH